MDQYIYAKLMIAQKANAKKVRDGLSRRNRVVFAPDFESDSQYQYENYEHNQGLKIFNYGYQIHINTRRMPSFIADKDFGFEIIQ